jgi:hypothetical protein
MTVFTASRRSKNAIAACFGEALMCQEIFALKGPAAASEGITEEPKQVTHILWLTVTRL